MMMEDLMGKRKILLVDDVSLLLEIEKSFLRNSPVRIFTAHNGEEALEVVRQERPDLIFMDLNMPKMNGLSCCAALKADERWRSIPVVMVTTAGRDEDIQLCRQAGCDDFITKPIDRRIFLEKGRKFLPDIDRRETRVPFCGKVSIRVDGVVVTGVIANISIGGLFVVSEETLSNDGNVVVTFSLSTNADEQIEVHGRISWQNSKAVRVKPMLPVGFGVEFMDAPEKTMEMIQAVVDSCKTPG
jgi:CheY-like chemotaxis protein